MTSRWTFITSSYSSTFFRARKFRLSTLFWAFSTAPERILASIGVSSSMPRLSIIPMTRSVEKRRIRSSSRLR